MGGGARKLYKSKNLQDGHNLNTKPTAGPNSKPMNGSEGSDNKVDSVAKATDLNNSKEATKNGPNASSDSSSKQKIPKRKDDNKDSSSTPQDGRVGALLNKTKSQETNLSPSESGPTNRNQGFCNKLNQGIRYFGKLFKQKKQGLLP